MKALAASVVFFILFLSVFTTAQTFPQWQDKYVNDFSGFLDSASVLQLRGLLSELEQSTTAEVVVITVPTTAPETPSQYRTELFNKWKIGKAANDNGLLILYAVKEKRIEVEVGYGLEGILPDSKVGSILDEFYVPYRDRNETVKGIVLATQEFARVINANAEEVRAGNAGGNNIQNDFTRYVGFLPLIVFPIIFFAIFLFPLIISYQANHPKCKKCGKRMKYVRSEDGYEIYMCENGHTLKRKKKRYGSWAVAAGGFGGGGGWGGGGGGGFGGGGSGGGGAGR